MLEVPYPNLELIEYKSRQILAKDEEFLKEYKDKLKENEFSSLNFEAYSFPQMWGDTSIGFDIDKHGNPTIAGQAFTKAYTTVMHECLTNRWIVFFGGRECYTVKDANRDFIDDLNKHSIASLSVAKNRY